MIPGRACPAHISLEQRRRALSTLLYHYREGFVCEPNSLSRPSTIPKPTQNQTEEVSSPRGKRANQPSQLHSSDVRGERAVTEAVTLHVTVQLLHTGRDLRTLTHEDDGLKTPQVSS